MNGGTVKEETWISLLFIDFGSCHTNKFDKGIFVSRNCAFVVFLELFYKASRVCKANTFLLSISLADFGINYMFYCYC